ncbi:MAG: hypothetical protein K2J85_04895, partial [Anaeroplasmataceae bacterium]|nr:hypothetical protein [Anaeroplasmataceae bacterium]
MRFMKKSCFIMQKITVLSILWIFLIVLIGCDKKQLNEEEHVHTKVHVLKIDPTCISEGRLEYWYCSQCNKVYRDRDVKYEISWEDTKLPKTEHIIEETAGVSATCEASGITVGKHCSYCNEVISEQEEILPLGHDYDYEQATWEWEGFAEAKMIASCKHDASHKEIYSANITSERTEATCEESGKTVYVASVFIEDKEYTNQKEDLILPLDHDFDLEHIEWDWDEENNVIAQIPCKHDAEHIEKYKASVKEETIPATCTTDGKRIFTASIAIEGQTYSDTKEIGIDSIGHTFDYDNINWVWEDHSAATATVYCKNDQSHQASYDATITSQLDAPTCTKEGKKTYIATITIDGKSFTDSKNETLSPLKHDFDYNSYTWEWTGYTQATIHFTCKYDKAHLDSYVGQIQSYIDPATCVQQGKIVYTASVKIHDTTYSDEKEEILPIDETAHDYNYAQPIWNWTAIVNGYTVSAKVTCKCGESSLEFENATLFVDATPATFEAPGLKKYTASVEIDGEHYFDTKIEELPIKQYVS